MGRRRPGALDLVAAAAATVAPRSLVPFIDQARLDLGSLARDLEGPRRQPFSSPTSPGEEALRLDQVDLLDALPRSVARPLRTAHRDLRMLASELRGVHAPHV